MMNLETQKNKNESAADPFAKAKQEWLESGRNEMLISMVDRADSLEELKAAVKFAALEIDGVLYLQDVGHGIRWMGADRMMNIIDSYAFNREHSLFDEGITSSVAKKLIKLVKAEKENG